MLMKMDMFRDGSASGEGKRRKRFRVNISIDEETYKWLKTITADIQARSISGSAAAMVRLMRDMQVSRQEATESQPDPYEDINDMFYNYEATEAKSHYYTISRLNLPKP